MRTFQVLGLAVLIPLTADVSARQEPTPAPERRERVRRELEGARRRLLEFREERLGGRAQPTGEEPEELLRALRELRVEIRRAVETFRREHPEKAHEIQRRRGELRGRIQERLERAREGGWRPWFERFRGERIPALRERAGRGDFPGWRKGLERPGPGPRFWRAPPAPPPGPRDGAPGPSPGRRKARPG